MHQVIKQSNIYLVYNMLVMQNVTNLIPSVDVPVQPDVFHKTPTPREIETLRHISNGNDSKTTARLMGISKRTVDYHLSNIYTKLCAGNRVLAINIARAKGYL